MRALIVKHGFGGLIPGVERRIGSLFFRVYRGDDDLTVYEAGAGDEVQQRLRIVADGLEVVPGPPVLAEPRITTIIMYKLGEPLVIEPGGKARISSCIPVDIVVALSGSIIDVRPSVRVKYALYGSLDRGFIARVVRDSSPPCARTEIEVVNAGGHPVRVSKIVFPGYMLNLCYVEDEEYAYASPLLVTIIDDVGNVQPRQAPMPSCRQAPQFLRAPIFEKQRFLMLHGF